VEKEETYEVGEYLMLNRILVKSQKESSETTQIKNMFRIVSNSKGKCCKIFIDSGSTYNFVSMEMVDKLALKRMAHPTPYKVS
jgi:hypothetical protein